MVALQAAGEDGVRIHFVKVHELHGPRSPGRGEPAMIDVDIQAAAAAQEQT